MADAAEKEDDQEEQGRRHQLWPVTVTTIGFQRSAGGSVLIPEFVLTGKHTGFEVAIF